MPAVAIAVDAEASLDGLGRALLQALSDQAGAHRLDTPAARDAASAIARALLRQASAALPDPIAARRAYERRAELTDALLEQVADEQDRAQHPHDGQHDGR